MAQNPDTSKCNITCFQKVRLTEPEFKHAHELDSDELKNIRDEYIKRRIGFAPVGIVIAAVLFVLWITGVIEKLSVFSEVIEGVILFLFAVSWGTSAYLVVRCIFALGIVSHIKKQNFYWHVGYITHKKLLWTFLKWENYYIVDNEYCSRTDFDPFYKRGTEVYFLYFPAIMKNSYMGGIVVRKNTTD